MLLTNWTLSGAAVSILISGAPSCRVCAQGFCLPLLSLCPCDYVVSYGMANDGGWLMSLAEPFLLWYFSGFFFHEGSWDLITRDRKIFTLSCVHPHASSPSLLVSDATVLFLSRSLTTWALFHVYVKQHFSWLPISFVLWTLCFINHFHHSPFQGPLAIP